MKKYSFVGIALVAAAAITSAFVPSSAKKTPVVLLGQIVNGSFDGTDNNFVDTCTDFGAGGNCSYTVTGAGIGESATGAGTDTITGVLSYTGFATTLNEEA